MQVNVHCTVSFSVMRGAHARRAVCGMRRAVCGMRRAVRTRPACMQRSAPVARSKCERKSNQLHEVRFEVGDIFLR